MEESNQLRAQGYARPGFVYHLGVVLHKNLLLKRRGVKGLVAEILLPVVFLVALIPAWKAAGTNDVDATSYLEPRVNLTELYGEVKCRRPGATDPRVVGFEECQARYLREDLCLGDLCATFPDDDDELLEVLHPLLRPRAATVPDFDTIALVRNYAHHHLLPGHSDFGVNTVNSLCTGYMVAIVPSTDAARSEAAALHDFFLGEAYTYQHVAKGFGSEAEATAWAKSKEGSQKMWGVVAVHGERDYSIRMNRTATPSTQLYKAFKQGIDDRYQMYIGGGFLTLQQMVNKHITGSTLDATVVPMPIAAYVSNDFLNEAGGALPLLLGFAFLFPVAQLVAGIVREKEARIREGMLIMGLSPAAFKLSWFLTSFVQMSVVAVLMALVLKASYMSGTSFLILFLLMWLQTTAIVCFAILLSVFFSKGQLAAIVSPLAFLLTAIPHAAMSEDTAVGTRKMLAFLFNNYAFAEGTSLLATYEGGGRGMQLSDLNEDEFSMNAVLGFLFMNCVVYSFLAWYLDHVFPSEWGSQKPFYFLFSRSYWCPRPPHVDPNAVDGLRDPTMVEGVGEEMKGKETLVLTHLRKVFKDGGAGKVAVNNMNLRMYEGQIQVLLGHNGAGKTTLINMLTGMLSVTSGNAEVYGRSVVNQLEDVRNDIGLCPQHNILWDRMTCAEHLRFFGRLKGVPSGELEERVEWMLRRVELLDKKDEYSSALSGGMKRKLSVAIALIGAPRLVIFDEPTAGMDVQARRAVWDLLKESRVGRTVLLTTHFMDEADLLGDSVAIMHSGRLYCWGSSMFLKSRLGVGYNLKLDVRRDADARGIQRALEAHVGGEVELLSSAGSELAFRIPLRARSAFPAMFRELEDDGEKLGVKGFGMSVTTLEEIFIRIASEEDADEDVSPLPSPTSASKKLLNSKNVVYGSTSIDMGQELLAPGAENGYVTSEEERMQGGELFWSQWRGLLLKRYHHTKRDRRTLCFQLLLPVLLIVMAIGLSLIPVTDLPSFDISKYDKQTLFPVPAGLDVTGHLPDGFDVVVRENGTAAEMDGYLLRTFDEHGSTERWQALGSDALGYSGFFNTSHLHSLPILHSTLATARLRERAGGEGVITAHNHPLPFSDYFRNQIKGWQAISVGILIMIPFTFIPSNYVSFLVRERESKAKHVQLVSGVRLVAFWLGTFVWDLATYLVTVLLAFAVFGMFDREEYVGDAGTGFALFMLFLFFGLAAIGMAYLLSFYFRSHTKGQNVVMMGNFMAGFVLVLVTNILEVIKSTENAGKVCRFIFRVVPPFCLGDGIIQLAQRPSKKAMGLDVDGPFAMDVTGYDILFLAIMTPVYFLLALSHDFPEILYALRLRRPPTADVDAAVDGGSGKEDEDVHAERLAVQVEGGRPGDVVTVRRLRKVYPASDGHPPKVAVRDVSFGVKSDEIFAFLGTNGAGKTTTLSVLSGDFPPTSGEASINGHNVVTHPGEARRQLGYCPQFDALLDLLTPKEHLEMYAALRGVPVEKRAAMVESLLEVLGLEKHRNTISKSLSGGNKRKTSIAIALIGGPACLLLDEPTAGMDPVARRGLWTALQKIGEGRCVVLTTHHLEEVEALAHRVAIMVDGGLECMGSLTHLKNKFGGSYEIEIKVDTADHELKTRAFCAATFPSAELTEATNRRLTYTLKTKDVRLSEIFSIIEERKADMGITDYSISQTSLEQVFITICKRHLEREHKEREEKAEAENQQQSVLRSSFTSIRRSLGFGS